MADTPTHLLATILEHAAESIVAVNGAQQIIVFNKAAEKTFGYSAEEVLGQPLDLLLPDQVVKAHHQHVQNFAASADPSRPMEHRQSLFAKRKDGSEFPVEIGLSKLETGDGILFTAMIVDITERRQSEKKISQQLERLTALREIDQFITSTLDLRISLEAVIVRTRKLLDVDAAAIWLLDPVRTILEYSVGAGLPTNTLKTTSLRLGEGLAGRVALERQVIQMPALAHQSENPFLTELLKEEKFVSYHGAPLIVKGRVLGVLEVYSRSLRGRDLDWADFFRTLAGQAAIAIDNAQLFEHLQRSQIELQYRVAERTDELNRTNAELEQANRAKDEFLANMSHELRTPLTSILGMSESLLEQRRGMLNESQQISLKIIESSGRHLLELINDILDLSKFEAGKLDYYPQDVGVDEICRSSLGFVKSQAFKKSINLTYRNEASISRISADPRLLKQILVNLLTNAVKFTPQGGQVTLHVRTEPEQRLIQFSVIDTGSGIAPDDLRRLFTPFAQMDRRSNRQLEGTGLGLAVVQKLIDLHGGSVHVESEVGVGSRFTIRLPCGEETIAQKEGNEPGGELFAVEEAEKPPDRQVVLLAEDHTATTLMITEYLESHGYAVVNAHDGLEAIQMAEQSNPDTILMDIQMLGMDGLETIRRLRANPRFAKTPIIALTAMTMPGDRERCLEAGADEYMSKPVRLKKLLDAIHNLLGKG